MHFYVFTNVRRLLRRTFFLYKSAKAWYANIMIYLDYAATTPLDHTVFEAMLPYFKDSFGNADSLHAYGRRAAYAVENARESVAKTLGVKPAEVYFTAGGTEADNWAVRCMGRGKACVSAIEHHAVLESAPLRADGFCLAPVGRDGTMSLSALEDVLAKDERIGLVCVMAVNNETGCIQPLKEISALCKAHGVALFSDCVQAAGELDLKEILSYCDGIALSAHKIYGPKGVGALVVKKGVMLQRLLAGGEQERSLRGGTLNVAGIVGFATALERSQAGRAAYSAHVRALRDEFERELKNALGERVVFNGEHRIGGMSHATFACGGTAFLAALDLHGVAAAGGAACAAHSQKPSHVLVAMGRSEEEAMRGVRFSFGKYTAREELSAAAQAVVSCAQRE